ncbi:EpsG family protein [Paraclostridium tenue]
MFVAIITFQLFIILALRSESVGADISRYIKNFNFISTNNWDIISGLRYEVGYKLLVKIISLITNDSQIFISIIAAISLIGVTKLIYKYSSMPVLSYWLYITFGFYTFIFSGLRQAIAISLVLISFDYLMENKIIKFILMVILASLFHKTAMAFIVCYPFKNINITKKNILSMFVSFLFIFIFRFKIMSILKTMLYDEYEIVASNSYTLLIVALIILMASLYFYKSVINKNSKNSIYYQMMYLSVCCLLLASTTTNMTRIADYFYIYLIILIPEVLTSIKDKKLAYIGITLVLCISFLQYMWLTPKSQIAIVPYKLFINK